MAKITFKGKEIHTIGELPQIGKTAPEFKLVRQDLSEVGLDAFRDKKKILNIFVSLDTGVCANSIKQFNELTQSIPDLVVLNISMDLPFAATRFCESIKKNHIETLSAFRSQFPEAYGVKIADGPIKGLLARAVVVLDEKNTILYTQLVPEITQEPDYQVILEKFKAKR